MGNRGLLFIVLLTLILLPSINAAPPFISNTGANGLDLFYPPFEFVPQNEDFTLHIHVNNLSNGVQFLATEFDCYVHLYYANGSHSFESGMLEKDSNNLEVEIRIDRGNFTELGAHWFYLHCNNTAQNLGGSVKGFFEVTPTGTNLETPDSIMYIFLLIAALCLFAFSFYWMLILKFGNFIDSETGELYGRNDWKYLKIFLIPINYVMLMWIFGIARSISANFLFLPGLTLFFNWAFWVMLSLAFPLLIVVLLFILLSVINDKKLNDSLKRGSPYNGP